MAIFWTNDCAIFFPGSYLIYILKNRTWISYVKEGNFGYFQNIFQIEYSNWIHN